MEQYKMPFLLIFSNEELAQLWRAYHEIDKIVSAAQERSRTVILDDEVSSGAHFRKLRVVEEMRKREKQGRAKFVINDEDGSPAVMEL